MWNFLWGFLVGALVIDFAWAWKMGMVQLFLGQLNLLKYRVSSWYQTNVKGE